MSTVTSRIWNILENHPYLTAILLVVSQTWFSLNTRALWFSDEVRHGNAYENLLHHGQWFFLHLNGQPYPDKPPLYFWFLRLLDAITPADVPTVFFLGTAISGLLLLWSLIYLGRSLGFSRRENAAALLIMELSLFFFLLLHYSRMDMLFSAFTVMTMASFFRYADGQGGKWAIRAFAFSAVAALIKGPFAFVFPLLGLGLLLFWRGEWKRCFSKEMFLGGFLLTGVILLWFLGAMLEGGSDYVFHSMIGKHVVQRFTNAFHHREPFYWYFIALPLSWMPWTVCHVAAGRFPFLRAGFWADLWRERRSADADFYLWAIFLASFVFLSSLSSKVLIYIMPLWPVMALLAARSFCRLSRSALRRVWLAAGGFWLVFGAGGAFAEFFIKSDTPMDGLGLWVLCLCALGAALLAMRNKGLRANLLVMLLGLTIWIYPTALITLPSLDNAMSPKLQGQEIGKYVAEGYTPMAFKIYSGIFTLYAGHNLMEFDDINDLDAALKAHPKAVVTMREKHYQEFQAHFNEAEIVHRQWIAGERYLLLRFDPASAPDAPDTTPETAPQSVPDTVPGT